MITRQQVIEKAREYKGTPFVHQARLKGIGIDCIGLIVGVGKELELFDYDHTVYNRYSDGTALMFHIKQVFIQIPVGERQPGDIVIYWVDKNTKHPQHVGILSDWGIIHTYDKVKEVVEHHSHATWDERIMFAFQWPGVNN